MVMLTVPNDELMQFTVTGVGEGPWECHSRSPENGVTGEFP